AAVRDKMIQIVESLGLGKIEEAEVERFKTRELKDFDLAMTNPGRIGIQLTEWAAVGDWRMMFLHRDRVQALTAERVHKFAQRYLKRANRPLGVFLPTKAPERSPLPPAIDVAALVKSYTGKAAVAEGEAFEATIENIEKRTTRTTLPSGMKLALLPKKSRGGA